MGAVTLVLIAVTAGLVSAQGPVPAMPIPTMLIEQESETAATHEQMHQMMDVMHGEGASERMHQAMGEDGERMMEQCVAMVNMMSGMRGRMGDEAMKDMTGEPGRGSMSNMMRRMMGRQEP